MGSRSQGGCACGALRTQLGEVREAGVCHCRACQRGSGAGAITWALVDGAGLVLTGEVTRHAGPPGERSFCPRCGTTVVLRHDGDPVGTVRVPLATLDAPDAITPTVHLGCAEQRVWQPLGERLAWSDSQVRPPDAERARFVRCADPRVTASTPLALRDVTAENLGAVLALDVTGPQRRYVASVPVSLAQAPHERDCRTHAIVAAMPSGDEIVVGFAMCQILDKDELGLPTKGDPYVVRFLVDRVYQGRGVGAAALAAIVAHFEAQPVGRTLWLSFVPGAHEPRAFYARQGFVETGVSDPDGELVLRRPLAARGPA